MTQLPLENLTPRQRQAYILRFRRGWRLRRIAAELGITVSSAGELVKRAQLRAVANEHAGLRSGRRNGDVARERCCAKWCAMLRGECRLTR
jgi:hypothetical protein